MSINSSLIVFVAMSINSSLTHRMQEHQLTGAKSIHSRLIFL
jgi:hypothetical protein